MIGKKKNIGAVSLALLVGGLVGVGLVAPSQARAADLDYGKPGEPIHLIVGYQPYYSESWSGNVVAGLGLWKKYLPAGSTVEFRIGLQGAVIVNAMLAGKESIGYLGDMPAIVAASKRGGAVNRVSDRQCGVRTHLPIGSIGALAHAPAPLVRKVRKAWLNSRRRHS